MHFILKLQKSLYPAFNIVFICLLYRKHTLNCHRMKPALFQILCEIKEKTGLLCYICYKLKIHLYHMFLKLIIAVAWIRWLNCKQCIALFLKTFYFGIKNILLQFCLILILLSLLPVCIWIFLKLLVTFWGFDLSDYFVTVVRGTKYCDQRVCLSVWLCLPVRCLLAYLKNHTTTFHQVFCTC